MTDFRRERALRGLSADEAARIAGLSPKTWSRIENGQKVRALTLAAAEKAFSDNPIAEESEVGGLLVSEAFIERVVAEVPYMSLDHLRRIRAAVTTAIIIRNEVSS